MYLLHFILLLSVLLTTPHVTAIFPCYACRFGAAKTVCPVPVGAPDNSETADAAIHNFTCFCAKGAFQKWEAALKDCYADPTRSSSCMSSDTIVEGDIEDELLWLEGQCDRWRSTYTPDPPTYTPMPLTTHTQIIEVTRLYWGLGGIGITAVDTRTEIMTLGGSETTSSTSGTVTPTGSSKETETTYTTKDKLPDTTAVTTTDSAGVVTTAILTGGAEVTETKSGVIGFGPAYTSSSSNAMSNPSGSSGNPSEFSGDGINGKLIGIIVGCIIGGILGILLMIILAIEVLRRRKARLRRKEAEDLEDFVTRSEREKAQHVAGDRNGATSGFLGPPQTERAELGGEPRIAELQG